MRTTAYHPQDNGMVERLHGPFKTSLMVQPDSHNWTHYLPLVLLSIHTKIKEDLDCSPTELTFGTSLRLPGDFVCPNCHSVPTPSEALASQRKTTMSRITATPQRQFFLLFLLQKFLAEAQIVFVGHETCRCGNNYRHRTMGLSESFAVRASIFLLGVHGKED